ncbi:MAG: hypothetical protein JJE13_09465 [Thermoleophilia bacterium]|nr:hypothetical protein [Thermoleophilia bacterium]
MLAFGFSACGSSSSDSDSESTEAETTTTTTAPANAEIVQVSMVEMAFKVDPSTVKAGNVTFDMSNDGTVPHELVVIKTNTKAGDLPTDSSGEASEAGAVGEAEVDSGKTDELTLKLASSHYALICNLPGHYKAGMYSDINVK